MGAPIGCQDRPIHASESAREPGRHRFDNVVVGRVPGGKLFRIGTFDPPEAHKGGHLVHVAFHGLAHQLERADIVVDIDLQQVPFAVC